MPVKITTTNMSVTICVRTAIQLCSRRRRRREEGRRRTNDEVDPRECLESVKGVGVSSLPVHAESVGESGGAGEPVEEREESVVARSSDWGRVSCETSRGCSSAVCTERPASRQRVHTTLLPSRFPLLHLLLSSPSLLHNKRKTAKRTRTPKSQTTKPHDSRSRTQTTWSP